MLPQSVKNRFWKDPEWHIVEETIMKFIEPLLDMTTIDVSAPPEMVKAEIIGRKLAYESLEKFVRSSGLVREPAKTKVDLFR